MIGDDELRAELESLERSAPSAVAPGSRPRRESRARRLVGGATAILLAGVVAITGFRWLSGADPSAPAGTSVPASPTSPGATPLSAGITPTSSPTMSAAATVAAVKLDWSTAPFFHDGGAWPQSIASVGGRLIVTGFDDTGAAAWYSDDQGEQWERSTVEDGNARRPIGLGPVAGSEDLLLSLGWVNVGGNDADRERVTWESTDLGSSWQRQPPGTVPDGIAQIAVGSGGFVGVGIGEGTDPDASLEVEVAAIWLSADGRAWERLRDAAWLDSVTLTALTAWNGQLFAAGAERVSDRDLPTAWSSADGREWTATRLSAAPGVVLDLAGGPDNLVAVGSNGNEYSRRPAAWLSRDGVQWTDRELGRPDDLSASDVAANGLGFVATVRAGGFEQLIPDLVWFETRGGVSEMQDIQAWVIDLAAIDDRFVGITACPPTASCFGGKYVVVGSPQYP